MKGFFKRKIYFLISKKNIMFLAVLGCLLLFPFIAEQMDYHYMVFIGLKMNHPMPWYLVHAILINAYFIWLFIHLFIVDLDSDGAMLFPRIQRRKVVWYQMLSLFLVNILIHLIFVLIYSGVSYFVLHHVSISIIEVISSVLLRYVTCLFIIVLFLQFHFKIIPIMIGGYLLPFVLDIVPFPFQYLYIDAYHEWYYILILMLCLGLLFLFLVPQRLSRYLESGDLK